MVRAEKLSAALYALNGILVWTRFMAQNEGAYTEIAEILDVAEYLVRLLAVPEDRTTTFRANLELLAKKHAHLKSEALGRFDEDPTPSW